MQKHQKKLIFFLVILFLALSFNYVWAQIISTPTGSCPKVNKGDLEGVVCDAGMCVAPYNNIPCNYTLNDIASTGINIFDRILGISGSLALLAFVYGGFMFLISAGSSEKIAKAKQIIVGAVIGLVIVFTSFMIVGFIMKATGVNTSGSSWAQTGWFK